MKDDLVNNQRVRCYDNGGETFDRYSAVYLDQPYNNRDKRLFMGISMNSEPFTGIGCHDAIIPGKHLGKRVAFDKLPPKCQQAIRQDTRPDDAQA